MNLGSALLALCSTIFSSPHMLAYTSTCNHTLTFDDLPTALHLSPVPPIYHHLKFTYFSVFAPHSPFLKDYITPYDLNCAVSSPNALLGSRSKADGPGASFEIANASTMADEGFQPYFTLRSLQLKPLVAPAPGTNIWIKGYRHGEVEKEPLIWDVDFPSGYHLPLLVDLAKFSKQSWDKLYKVEIGADFGYDALDWEFCLDDLEVQFVQNASQIRGGQAVVQNFQEADW